MKKTAAFIVVSLFLLLMLAVSSCRDRLAIDPKNFPTETYTPTATATPTPVQPQVIEDFPSNSIGQNSLGGVWFDYGAGGNAFGYYADSPGYDSSGYALHMTSTVAASCDYGVWLVTTLNAATAAADLSHLTGIKFWAKDVNAEQLRFVFLSDNTSNNYQFTYTAPSAWTQVTLPFASFTQTTTDTVTVTQALKAVKRIAWVNGGCNETMDLWLDHIEFY